MKKTQHMAAQIYMYVKICYQANKILTPCIVVEFSPMNLNICKNSATARNEHKVSIFILLFLQSTYSQVYLIIQNSTHKYFTLPVY